MFMQEGQGLPVLPQFCSGTIIHHRHGDDHGLVILLSTISLVTLRSLHLLMSFQYLWKNLLFLHVQCINVISYIAPPSYHHSTMYNAIKSFPSY